MSSSSRIALISAFVLLAVGFFMYVRTQDTRAPALSPRVVEALLRKASEGIHQRDIAAVMDLTTSDATIFGMRRIQAQRALAQTLREMAPGRLIVSWRDLQVIERGNVGTAEFEVSVEERLGSTDAVYLQSHITLDLVKVRRPTWLGLSSCEEWLVRRAESSTGLTFADG